MVSELTKYQGVICTKNIKGKEHKVKKGNQIRPFQKMMAFGPTLEGGKEGSHGYLSQAETKCANSLGEKSS